MQGIALMSGMKKKIKILKWVSYETFKFALPKNTLPKHWKFAAICRLEKMPVHL